MPLAAITQIGAQVWETGRTLVEELPAATAAAIDKYGNFEFELRRRSRPKALTLVAEGDSWFDFKPSWIQDPKKGDLLSQLNHSKELNIYRVSKAGDTIENMVYGTDYDREFSPRPGQITSTLEAVQRYQPHGFLFSGGGNDIVGDELAGYLNHAATKPADLLRTHHVRFVFRDCIAPAIRHLISRLREQKPGLPVFLHGYDYAIPTGRGVIRIPPGWTFIGPWLRPAFAAKRIPLDQAAHLVKRLIDEFNQMQIDLAKSLPGVHHIDLRGTLTPTDWSDELHPTPAGFAKVATKMKAAILAQFPAQA